MKKSKQKCTKTNFKLLCNLNGEFIVIAFCIECTYSCTHGLKGWNGVIFHKILQVFDRNLPKISDLESLFGLFQQRGRQGNKEIIRSLKAIQKWKNEL